MGGGKIGNRAACYRIEKRGTPENSWGGCWEECCENSEFGVLEGVLARVLLLIPFQGKPTPSQHPRRHPEFPQHSSQHPPQLFSEVPICLFLQQAALFPRVKQGRFVILHFPLFCNVWGSQDTQMPRKKQHKKCHCHTPFVCPRCK